MIQNPKNPKIQYSSSLTKIVFSLFFFFFLFSNLFQIPISSMRVAPLSYIILLCRPLSTSESSPLVRHPFNVHLSTPILQFRLPGSCIPPNVLELVFQNMLDRSSLTLQQSFPERSASFSIADAHPLLHRAECELERSTAKLSESTAPGLERALPHG